MHPPFQGGAQPLHLVTIATFFLPREAVRSALMVAAVFSGAGLSSHSAFAQTNPPTFTNRWGVSQGAPFRRMHIANAICS